MTRDCTTIRINRLELLDLLDASAAPERQMVTMRMPALRVQDLDAVPEALALAEGTPPIAISPPPAAIVRTPHVSGGGDVTLISIICAVSMAICGALAWIT